MIINKDLILDLVHPIGSIYMSVNSTSPETLFGGTWTKITNDAYLKIVSNNAGNLGGTASDHKIPVSSMPNHSHKVRYVGKNANGIYGGMAGTSTNVDPNYNKLVVAYEGGGEPYYPYYYGVYVWKRTA